MNHLLAILTLMPLVGAAFILLFVRENDPSGPGNARTMGLWTTVVTFALSLALWHGFDTSQAGFQFQENYTWIEGAGIKVSLGVDGISLFLILLTTFLMPICLLAGWHAITTRVKEFVIYFLVMETFILGVFSALDIFLFYVCFEGVLIPMFLIIGIWGGGNRIYAAYKFFLYTLLGSVLFLLAVLYLYYTFGTASIPTIMARAPLLAMAPQCLLWLAMFASFAVKVPMWPVHTWLPDAHVQAPTAGSVILAGILLKMGGYGFIRFSLPMLPDASQFFAPFMFTLSVIAVIYTSLVALMQEDMKKLIAYSSVAHMGFVTLGLFTFTPQGIEGAMVQMISHGLISGALFLCVGVVYDRLHTREIARYGGLVNIMPRYAAVFLFFILASAGLPGTSGFVGEILVLIGAFQASTFFTALAATGLILGAAYGLWLYRRVVFGELARQELKNKMSDMNHIEWLMFAPLVIFVLWLGVYPAPVLDVLHPSTQHLIEQIGKSIIP